ncbi:hypothetical protein PUN28_015214 [Cardiocondyla obscurior]|uniref:Uncharacterized protein n=1 Tax=Cardiocondyla obscurior TaxID=286306 RepID=A0AAW2F084_9HYME
MHVDNRDILFFRLLQICATSRRHVYRTFRCADVDSNSRDEHYFATSTSNNPKNFDTHYFCKKKYYNLFLVLQITQETSDILEATRYVFYVIGQLIHLFFLSFEGQRLIDHSLEIRDKMYSSFWYKASMKLQKLVMMVMMKSLQPSFLSAGKIYIFSLQSFTMILQTSMSYFTVLATFQ